MNVPILPDYSGDRVNTYYDIVKICYGLIQQRQFLLRDNSVFKCVNDEQVQSTTSLGEILHRNCTVNGLYNKARQMQKLQIKKRFVNKEKVSFLIHLQRR